MLEMRKFCECCGRLLAVVQFEAMICSFECTFCMECAATKLHGNCPNCGGNLVVRPTRPDRFLDANPPSAKRIVKEQGCVAAVRNLGEI